MPIYIATELQRKEIDSEIYPIADALGEWRWLAQGPWWYFESKEVLSGYIEAPITYPNGIVVNDGTCINKWLDKPIVIDPLAHRTNEEILKSVKMRGLKVL